MFHTTEFRLPFRFHSLPFYSSPRRLDKAVGILGVEGMLRNRSVWFTKLLKLSGWSRGGSMQWEKHWIGYVYMEGTQKCSLHLSYNFICSFSEHHFGFLNEAIWKQPAD